MTEPGTEPGRPVPSSEVLGLLREIREHSRGEIRLIPRRPPLQWFDGETVRPSEVSRDRAVRHLVASHREELAQLLYDAARIAYWKKPSMSHVPIHAQGDALKASEQAWRRRAEWETEHGDRLRNRHDLLHQCLSEVSPDQCSSLASASLALVPRDEARLFLGHGLKNASPNSALALFEWVARNTRDSVTRADALSGVGGRLCYLGRLEEAIDAYGDEARATPDSSFPWLYLFNLTCALGRSSEALKASAALGDRISPGDARLEEAARHIESWLERQAQEVKRSARATVRAVAERLSPPAARLAQAHGN